jgi:predicted dehydrogenase/threonine dehydrogenase-like Zn-dependent dehydrogenase
MKQVLQNARTGEIGIVDVPAPKLLPGCVVVRMAASLVSTGTERASSEFASKSLFQKAQARPDLVREVAAKMQRDGLFSAVAAVRSRLDVPGALGYSSAGTVVGVGEGVTDLCVGDRVACAGAGYAVHAEFACIPRLLVAKIPSESGSLEEAAFTTVGAVALHGVRVAEAKVGELIAVIGLGLLGQLTLQVLRAAGCRVLGMDLIPQRADLALRNGAQAVSSSESAFRDLCLQQSAGRGVDAVLITAETPSSAPVNLAAELARDRGIVVAVGTVGMDIQRKFYYEKELDFRIARSYGPGRYDTAYEQKGRDYPIGYVRWTETRNMEAFLQLIADGELTLGPLITHRFPIERAHGAYDLISGKRTEPSLGVLITYAENADDSQRIELKSGSIPGAGAKVAIACLGTGAFATGTLLPALQQTGAQMLGACGATGSKTRHVGEKFRFSYCTTDEHKLLTDPGATAVVIATRHHLHAGQVCAALRAGKHVFCEKPLCLREDELVEIVRTYAEARVAGKPQLMVGFNRRFSPMAIRMKKFLLETAEPLALHYRVNAGYIPADHWVNDLEQGGGRLLGEVCHFVDFLCFLAGEAIEVQARVLANPGQYSGDNVIVSLAFASGSQGTITYVANGDKSFSKERLEVFGGGRVAVLEDFRSLELVSHGRKQRIHSRFRQDKGHRAECAAFANAIRAGGTSPIPFEEIVGSTLATLRAAQSLASGTAAAIDASKFIHSALYPSPA